MSRVFADQENDAAPVLRAVLQHANRLFGGVDHVGGIAAGVDLAHRQGDLVGVGSELLQGADAMIESHHRGFALIAQNQRVHHVADLVNIGQHLLHRRVGLHQDHHRDRLIGHVHMDILFLLVVHQVKLVWLQAVDEIAVAVVDQHRRQDVLHHDPDAEVGCLFLGRRRILRGRHILHGLLREQHSRKRHHNQRSKHFNPARRCGRFAPE